ncbi:MAG: GTP 3',8-cyclase MoaA [Telmatospirillum sp.]|nr:GTP 3',8-cyclase MoaA [Telmatospirillum sp.]
MIDPFGRTVTYLRLSVTDRCNLRCFYCMGGDPDFLPHRDVLTIEELARAARCFIRQGVSKLRITGGEPLVRRGVLDLIAELGREISAGRLSELTMTTNGLGLAIAAPRLRDAGMRRVNVSLDTLDTDRFGRITGGGRIDRVLQGIGAARSAGLQVKINTVLLPDTSDREIDSLIAWAGSEDMALTFIEAMPLGGLSGRPAGDFPSLRAFRERLATRWTLLSTTLTTGGPARYVRVAETGGTLGFIGALSGCFCDRCNRVRMTSAGWVTWCLEGDDGLDLRSLLRKGADDPAIEQAILTGLARKPGHHHFSERQRSGQSAPPDSKERWRMNRTGG